MKVTLICDNRQYEINLVENTFIMYQNGELSVDLDNVISCIDLHDADIRVNNGAMSIEEMRVKWEKHTNVLSIVTSCFEMK